MSTPLSKDDIYTDAGFASGAVFEGYDWTGEPQYETPPAVMTEVALFESGGDPNSVSADGKHFGLGNIAPDGYEAGFYDQVTGSTVTQQDLMNPDTNLRVMAIGLAKRFDDQKGGPYEGDWYAAAAAYAGNADAQGHFDPSKGDPVTGVSGQAYYDAIKKGVTTDFPADEPGVTAGRGSTGSVQDPKSLTGQISDLFKGITDSLGKAVLTVGFIVGGIALVATLGIITSKALSDGPSDAGNGSAVKTAAKLAVL